MKLINFLILLLFTTPAFSQTDSIRMFMFGHSLVNYESELTTNNEGAIAHWVYKFAEHDNQYFAATGQFGFLPQHANLPPTSQWGFAEVPTVWESDYAPFSEADFNQILLTAANFAQWQSSNQEYPTDPGVSPLSATQTIIDWINNEEDNVTFYIYENWPDMAPYLNGDFPPTQTQFNAYNTFTQGEFHDWWIEYQDFLMQSHAATNVRMIPVGPIMARIHEQLLANQIPLGELYEDDAPHGRSSTYFLASMITYMAIFEKPIRADFNIPATIHPAIGNQFENIITFIFNELLDFNFDNGDSRVFQNNPSTSNVDLPIGGYHITFFPNPTFGSLHINSTNSCQISIFDIFGKTILMESLSSNSSLSINIANWPAGQYILKSQDQQTGEIQNRKILKY